MSPRFSVRYYNLKQKTKGEEDTVLFACPKGYLNDADSKEAAINQRDGFFEAIANNSLQNEQWGATLRIAGSSITNDFSVCVLTVTDFFKLPTTSDDCGDSPVKVNENFT